MGISSAVVSYFEIINLLGSRSAAADHIFSQIGSEWAPAVREVPHEQVRGHPQGGCKEAVREESLGGHQGD